MCFTMSPAFAGLFFAFSQALWGPCGSGFTREEAGTAQQIRAFSAYLDNLLKFLKFLLASISECP